MYHGIHDQPGSDNFDPVYSVTRGQFEAQMDWLQRAGYTSCLLPQSTQTPGPEKPVVITFDDGDITNFTQALPILTARAMVAEFYVISDAIGIPEKMDVAQLRAAAEAGMRIQSHGKTHRFLSDLGREALEHELLASKQRLQSELGNTVDTLSLPGGRGSEQVIATARALGYKMICTSEPGLVSRNADPLRLKRIAITRDLSLDDFASLIAGGRVLQQQILKFRVLKMIKMLLGNRRYDELRERFAGE